MRGIAFKPSLPAAWQAVAQAAERLQNTHIADLFAQNPQRFAQWQFQLGPLLLDISKQRLDEEALASLLALAKQQQLDEWISRLFSHEKVNHSEGRPAWHWALRASDSQALKEPQAGVFNAVAEELAKMERIVEKIHAGHWRGISGEPITDVVNIGVGGSDLGPFMLSQALADAHASTAHPLRVHFVSSMDGSQLSPRLRELRPDTTLFIVSSKSFTTVDTLYNAATARAWLERHLGNTDAMLRCHFIGVSAAADKMAAWGIQPENQLNFWSWVGGRFSLWSAIGLPIAIRIGMGPFRELLAGAHAMDVHFKNTPWEKNIPVLMGLVGVWNTNALGISAHAILPYDGRLKFLPSYLEQLEMESNGKSVDREGNPVAVHTCPVLWGDVGSNAQHAFYQLLHQGTVPVTCDFIVSAKRYHEPHHGESEEELRRQHELSLANCLAQSRLLAFGEKAFAQEENAPSYKRYPGNQPSTTLLCEEISPYAMGALLAAYEHKVFVQSVLWNINPFDQWGVEMGKVIATETLGYINQSEPIAEHLDSSTQGLIAHIHAHQETE